jgi:hypothetical protein
VRGKHQPGFEDSSGSKVRGGLTTGGHPRDAADDGNEPEKDHGVEPDRGEAALQWQEA